MQAVKKYVGAANILPDSRTPRRFPMAMAPTARELKRTRWGKRAGIADVSAAIPATADTDTVST
jgi:hypothetical protein